MLPENAAELPVLRLKRHEERRLAAGHLWVFSNEIDAARTPLSRFSAGELVRVLTWQDRSLGVAYVNPHSLICARLLQTEELPSTPWFERRLRLALALRERLYEQPCYRWVYGEADGLPGLVIDRFAEDCVVQVATAGMQSLLPELLEALRTVGAPRRVLLKNDSPLRTLEGLQAQVEWAWGETEAAATVIENGARFCVDLKQGQKTGWFYDQAANRRRLESYVRPDTRVLDLFCYAGAWGIASARLGAPEVLCVDASPQALAAAASNAKANDVRVEARAGDAFDVLEALLKEGRQFDLIIVDPPAFAKRRKDVPAALAAYRRINQLAMRAMASEGILVACSCSYHVGSDEFQGAVARAARTTGRHLQILERGGQSPDHPVHPAIAESNYLKALFCRVNQALS